MFIVFLALAVGPVVAGTKINSFLKSINATILKDLLQPTGQDNNDTTGRNNATGAGAAATSGSLAPTSTGGARIVKLF